MPDEEVTAALTPEDPEYVDPYATPEPTDVQRDDSPRNDEVTEDPEAETEAGVEPTEEGKP